MTDWVVAIVGSLLVAVVVRDVFHTLFHPIGHGSIAPQVMKFVWWVLRLFPSHRRIASLTGPLGIALVVLTWGAIAVLGWAMLYFAQMPDGFAYSSELNPAERNERVRFAVRVTGDHRHARVRRHRAHVAVASPDRPTRGAVRVHASHRGRLLGSPDLPRPSPQTRLGVGTLDSARGAPSEAQTWASTAFPSTSSPDLPTRLSRPETTSPSTVRRTIFATSKRTLRWHTRSDYATQLAAEAAGSAHPQTRLAGALITAAVDSLAGLLNEEFLRLDGDTGDVIRAYAADHRHTS